MYWERVVVNSLGLQVSFLCYVKVRTKLLFCALSPKHPWGGNATVPLTHIRLQAEYFIASLVGNLIPCISTLNHKTYNLTSVLLYFVQFILFFIHTYDNPTFLLGLLKWEVHLRTNNQTTKWSNCNCALHCYCRSPEPKRYLHTNFHSSQLIIETRKKFINFI